MIVKVGTLAGELGRGMLLCERYHHLVFWEGDGLPVGAPMSLLLASWLPATAPLPAGSQSPLSSSRARLKGLRGTTWCQACADFSCP